MTTLADFLPVPHAVVTDEAALVTLRYARHRARLERSSLKVRINVRRAGNSRESLHDLLNQLTYAQAVIDMVNAVTRN